MTSPSTPLIKPANRVRATRGKATGMRVTKPGAKEAAADRTRGARMGLLPTSGPRAALSSKKAKKLEKRLAHALKRRMETEGEVVMKDAEVKDDKKKAGTEETMDVDSEIA